SRSCGVLCRCSEGPERTPRVPAVSAGCTGARIRFRNRPSPSGWFPRRGEVCLAALDKQRSGVIISCTALNRHSLDVCVVPVSTAEHKNFSLRPRLPAGEGGLSHDSWVKCDQVTTIEKALIGYPASGVLSPTSISRVEQAIKQALELP